MLALKQSLDAGGHIVLEMPSGTGKTITLLSLILAYHHIHPTRPLLYCSRTVQEIEKALAELQRLMEYRSKYHPNERVLGLGLASRKNLCVHPQVSQERRGQVVDSKCMAMTASWVREKTNTDRCDFFETLERQLAMDEGTSPLLQQFSSGVYTMDELKEYGKLNGVCPYFLARKLLTRAQVVIYSYHYLLDPKVAEMVSRETSKDAIVVFDEAHNIDNVCIDSMSFDITRPILDHSMRSLSALGNIVQDIKQTNRERLEDEYRKLVQGLRETTQQRQQDLVLANPVLPDDLLEEAVPGNIRKAEHFIAFLRRFVEFLKTKLKPRHVTSETPLSFLLHCKDMTMIESKPLRFAAERLGSLIRTLEIRGLEEYSSLQRVAHFASIVSTYLEGFLLIMEPFEGLNSTLYNPTLHLCCLDASIAIRPVLKRYKSVVITSGTLSPLDMLPKILDFRHQVCMSRSFDMSLARNSFNPLVITRGSDQVNISSKFEVRTDPAVVRNYGQILLEFAKLTPDGIVAFFPSYIYLETIVALWTEQRIIDKLLQYKLVFVETPDALETSFALENYKRACDHGRGAVLLSVARGKVAEGIDFENNYGRAVLMFGIPYQYTESRILKARLEYMRDQYQIRENDFLTFDAIRQAAQCVGRVIRGKTDYGMMVFCDKRYARQDKRSKLPLWIQSHLTEANVNLSTDMALVSASRFFREMAQPFDLRHHMGTALWTLEDIEKNFPGSQQMGLEMNSGGENGNEMEADDKTGK